MSPFTSKLQIQDFKIFKNKIKQIIDFTNFHLAKKKDP